MTDFNTTQVRGHQRNIERYCRLLATELTDLERRYLHKRIAEEHAQLERLEKSQGEEQTDVVMATAALPSNSSNRGGDRVDRSRSRYRAQRRKSPASLALSRI